MKRTAVFPGSFDPVTKGHEAIIHRALSLFDEIIIAVGTNQMKKNLFPLSAREDMLNKVFSNVPGIKVVLYEGLTVDFCKKANADFIIRGLRTSADFEFERAIAQANKAMAPEIETIFFLAFPEHSHITSTIVRDIIRSGGDASRFVPDAFDLNDYKKDES